MHYPAPKHSALRQRGPRLFRKYSCAHPPSLLERRHRRHNLTLKKLSQGRILQDQPLVDCLLSWIRRLPHRFRHPALGPRHHANSRYREEEVSPPPFNLSILRTGHCPYQRVCARFRRLLHLLPGPHLLSSLCSVPEIIRQTFKILDTHPIGSRPSTRLTQKALNASCGSGTHGTLSRSSRPTIEFSV